jgi:hypothetical protein
MNIDPDFKALAYPAPTLSDLSKSSDNHAVSPCLCHPVFRCDQGKLATLLLIATIPTAQGAESQFVLQYDAHDLMPSAAKLSSGAGHLTHAQLDEILPVTAKAKAKTRPDIKTLDLSIKHTSPLWCPAGNATFSPKPGCEPTYQALVDLARATTIHIVLEYSHVRKEYQGSFKAFSKASRGLAGYPVAANLVDQGLRKATWEVFTPTHVAEAPPAYEGSRTRKRLRQGKLLTTCHPAHL